VLAAPDYLAVYERPEEVAALAPDLAALADLLCTLAGDRVVIAGRCVLYLEGVITRIPCLSDVAVRLRHFPRSWQLLKLRGIAQNLSRRDALWTILDQAGGVWIAWRPAAPLDGTLWHES
jgi:hypothetical protein